MMYCPSHKRESTQQLNLELHPEFKKKVFSIFDEMTERGFRVEIFRGKVTFEEQACLWTRSRSCEEIQNVASAIKKEGAPKIAELIENARSIAGRKETDLLPGQSWHQYGEAIDFKFLDERGLSIWNPEYRGYHLASRLAKLEDLVSGFFWKRVNVNHLQFKCTSVRASYSWSEINEIAEREIR